MQCFCFDSLNRIFNQAFKIFLIILNLVFHFIILYYNIKKTISVVDLCPPAPSGLRAHPFFFINDDYARAVLFITRHYHVNIESEKKK